VPDFGVAIDLINAHEYDNGIAIFTRDGNAARQYSLRIQVGTVGINVPIPLPMRAAISHGGTMLNGLAARDRKARMRCRQGCQR